MILVTGGSGLVGKELITQLLTDRVREKVIAGSPSQVLHGKQMWVWLRSSILSSKYLFLFRKIIIQILGVENSFCAEKNTN